MPPSPPCWCVPISVLGRLPARPSALTPRWWIDYNMSMGPKNTYICKHHFFVDGIFHFMKLRGKLGVYLWTVACNACRWFTKCWTNLTLFSRFSVFWLQNIPGLKFLPVLFLRFFHNFCWRWWCHWWRECGSIQIWESRICRCSGFEAKSRAPKFNTWTRPPAPFTTAMQWSSNWNISGQKKKRNPEVEDNLKDRGARFAKKN